MTTIRMIEHDTEKLLLAEWERQGSESINQNVLQCRFSQLPHKKPLAANLLAMELENMLLGREGRLFYCRDRDVLVVWKGSANDVIKKVQDVMTAHCVREGVSALPDDFFHYYDFHVHGEALRVECQQKIDQLPAVIAAQEKATATVPVEAEFSAAQKQMFAQALLQRPTHQTLHILIVEDQLFSRKLMLSVLDKQHHCVVAKNGAEAMAEYATHAPDIAFLDVELPDVDGHSLAKLFRQQDPDAYLVMVTANHYARDVEQAKANKVQGFVVKPYNKQKILGSVDQYHLWKNKRKS